METPNIPAHIAFIMDGNGRWAKKRMLPRTAGHREGVRALEKVITACKQLGVQAVTFYAFSTENWKRPQKEIDELFAMVVRFADEKFDNYQKDNLRLMVAGDRKRLPVEVNNALDRAIEKSKNNTGMKVVIALNYGGRDEIARAVNKAFKAGERVFTPDNISLYLDTAGIPDPDIIVRSSGEQRLSNFLLWQAAYSEFVFVPEAWPEFNKRTIDKIIKAYNERVRRFGDIK